jgi:hypothetical protein
MPRGNIRPCTERGTPIGTRHVALVSPDENGLTFDAVIDHRKSPCIAMPAYRDWKLALSISNLPFRNLLNRG